MQPILRAEIARVHRELVAFRDQCLPAFFEPGGPLPWPIPPAAKARLDALARPPWSRRDAANRLLDALPINPPSEADSPLDRAEYEDFLLGPVPTSLHVVRDGRIVWRIELHVGWDWTDALLPLRRAFREGRGTAGPDPEAGKVPGTIT